MKTFIVSAAVLLAALTSLRADWQRTDTTLAWRKGDAVVWRLSFDPARGKPFFHPLSIDGGTSLTNFRPEDHPWHYGMWFSWKFINGANYWEENRQTGRSEGATRWSEPTIQTHEDGRAIIAFEVTYSHPTGRVDLTEVRVLQISAPAGNGGYFIDWTSVFTAGPIDVVLDRSPLPGEPGGKYYSGYAGLSVRLASTPAAVEFVSTDGPISDYEHERSRPAVPAVAANVTENGRDVGALAILSAPENIGERAPWYLVRSEMRFACAAVLAPKKLTLPAGKEWRLNYRIALRPNAWTAEDLQAALATWKR